MSLSFLSPFSGSIHIRNWNETRMIICNFYKMKMNFQWRHRIHIQVYIYYYSIHFSKCYSKWDWVNKKKKKKILYLMRIMLCWVFMLMEDFRKEICDDMFMQCDIERDISTMKNSKFEQQYARTMSNELWSWVLCLRKNFTIRTLLMMSLNNYSEFLDQYSFPEYLKEEEFVMTVSYLCWQWLVWLTNAVEWKAIRFFHYTVV